MDVYPYFLGGLIAQLLDIVRWPNTHTILFAFILKDYITQRVTTNAIILVAYGIGNAAGPFMWKQQYRPR